MVHNITGCVSCVVACDAGPGMFRMVSRCAVPRSHGWSEAKCRKVSKACAIKTSQSIPSRTRPNYQQKLQTNKTKTKPMHKKTKEQLKNNQQKSPQNNANNIQQPPKHNSDQSNQKKAYRTKSIKPTIKPSNQPKTNQTNQKKRPLLPSKAGDFLAM